MNSCKTSRVLQVICMITVVSFVIVAQMIYSSFTAVAANKDRSKTIYELENELKDMKSEQTKLKDKIASDKATAASYAREIEDLDREISILTEQSAIIEELFNEWQAVKDETQAQIDELEDEKESELSAFDSMLRMSYQYGDDTYFNLIFGSEDIGDFLSRTDLLSYHFEANDNILTKLSSTITKLEDANKQYETSISQLDVFGKEQEELKKQLEEREKYALDKKLEYEKNAEINQKELNAKQAEMSQMEAEIKRLYLESRKNDGTTYSGIFCTPTKNYRLSSPFGWRNSPISGKKELHNGLDFAAPAGTPIYAADDGTVIDSRYSNSWGNVVQIDHGGGVVTLYAHASARLVSKGQTVKKGETIAKVGSTGWSTGNHLHFTVYKNGTAVDPMTYLGAV